MLRQSQRATILELHAQGRNKREIAKLLNLSRQSVRKVLQANSIAVPKIDAKRKPRRTANRSSSYCKPARAISCESMKSS